MTEPRHEPTAEITIAELDELGYAPGVVTGKHRDPSLLWLSVRGMSDERLGRLCRSMGSVTSRFLHAEHTEHLPPVFDHSAGTEEEFDAHRRELARFHDYMTTLKVFAGDKMREMITDSSRQPAGLHRKTTIFRVDEPVLYFEHWGTEDLGEPERDPVEIQMFVGLNDYTRTSVGLITARSVLTEIVGDYGISQAEVPDKLKTLGTINPQVFEPFVRTVRLGKNYPHLC